MQILRKTMSVLGFLLIHNNLWISLCMKPVRAFIWRITAYAMTVWRKYDHFFVSLLKSKSYP